MNHLRKYLIFKLNEHQYGVPISDVKEVIGLPQMIPIPQSPRYLMGLINLRGKVISAIDLKKKLSISSSEDVIKRPAVILVENEVTTIGCLVDSISEVFSISEDSIERSVDSNIPVNASYITGVARFKDRSMILMIDLKMVTDLSELEKFKSHNLAG